MWLLQLRSLETHLSASDNLKQARPSRLAIGEQSAQKEKYSTHVVSRTKENLTSNSTHKPRHWSQAWERSAPSTFPVAESLLPQLYAHYAFQPDGLKERKKKQGKSFNALPIIYWTRMLVTFLSLCVNKTELGVGTQAFSSSASGGRSRSIVAAQGDPAPQPQPI